MKPSPAMSLPSKAAVAITWSVLWLAATPVLALAVRQPTSSRTSTGFHLDVTANPLYKANGPSQHFRSLVKWGGDVPGELADLVSNKGSIGTTIAKNESHDLEYLSPVSIGSPPQEVLLDIDTGSSDLWVISSETRSVGARTSSRQIWKPELSTTAASLNESLWSITYGDGSYATGNVWQDTVDIGGIIVQDAVVESAVTISRSLVSDANISGLLGLAYRQPSQVQPSAPRFLTLLEPLLAQPLFTVDLRYHAPGLYRFGGIDDAAYVGNITWVPLAPRALFWEFTYTSINVGSSRVWLFSSWSAIADTGTTLLLFPADLAARYYAEVPGAKFNTTLGAWVFPCDQELPDFHIGFGDWVARVPGEYLNYAALADFSPGSSGCYGGIQGNGGLRFAILGDIFLKALFAVFDVAGGRVGFANKSIDA